MEPQNVGGQWQALVELAERSKALESGSSPKGRGFKSHTPHNPTFFFGGIFVY